MNLVSARDAVSRVTKDLLTGVSTFDEPARDKSNAEALRLQRWIDTYLEETGGALDLQP